MKGPLVDYRSQLMPSFLKAPDLLQDMAETGKLRPQMCTLQVATA